MRPIWNGALSFGLITIPVRLYSAAKQQPIKFKLLEKKTRCPIGYKRICKATGKEVDYDDIVKGYEIEKGRYVILEEEDFERAHSEKTETIDVIEFVNEDEIDIRLYERPYYLEPEKRSEKAYALLCKALKESGKVGVAKFVLRTREHIATLKPEGNMLILDQLRFPTDIRPPEDLHIPEKENYSKKELDMALSLIREMSDHFKPQEFKDTYTAEILRVIDEKQKGKRPKKKGKKPEYTQMKDLMKALQKSLEKEKVR